MARDLIARRQRAILIVDNCNANTHSELARLCAATGGGQPHYGGVRHPRPMSPNRRTCSGFSQASPKLVSEWTKQSFPQVSQIDRERIVAFSDGNFRVAAALAQRLVKAKRSQPQKTASSSNEYSDARVDISPLEVKTCLRAPSTCRHVAEIFTGCGGIFGRKLRF